MVVFWPVGAKGFARGLFGAILAEADVMAGGGDRFSRANCGRDSDAGTC